MCGCECVYVRIGSAPFEMGDDHGGVREATWQNPAGFVLFKQIKKRNKKKGFATKKEELRNFSLDCRIVN